MDKNTNQILTLVGSSRRDSNSKLVSEYFSSVSGSHLVDLVEKDISYFDYDHKNRGDDFLPLIKEFINNYESLVIVTPIYWYTISAQVKVFLDRLSDLITIEKELGRQLRSKSIALISQTESGGYEDWFAEPIRLVANYLGMKFISHVHVSIEGKKISENDKKRLSELCHSFK